MMIKNRKSLIYNKWIHICLLFIITFLLYWQSTGFEFVLDDKIVISENSFVKKGVSGIPEIFGNDSMTGFLGNENKLLAGGRYRPLSLAIFAIEYEIWGLNPFWFHLSNILTYYLCIAVLYFLLINLFNNKPHKFLNLAASIAALVFIIHPIHTEVVANIKGRDEILALLFSMSSLLLMLQYTSKQKIKYVIFSCITLLLAILAKENSISFVAIIPLTLYFFKGATLKRALKHSAVLIIPVFFYVLIRLIVLGDLFSQEVINNSILNDPYLDVSTGQKFATIFYTIVLYIKLIFIPHPLTHDYYPYHIALLNFFSIKTILSFVLIIGLIVYSLLKFKNKTIFSFIILCFFATLFIISNIPFNVGTFMNERFLFMPSLVVPIFISWFLLNPFPQLKRISRLLFTVLLSVFIFGFTMKSIARIPDWRTPMTLYKSGVNISKNSAVSNCFYGVGLYEKIITLKTHEEKKDLINEAKIYINRSLDIFPEYGGALRIKAGLASQEYKYHKDLPRFMGVLKEILEVRHIPYVDELINWLLPRSDKQTMAKFLFDIGYNIMAVQKKDYPLAIKYLEMANKNLANQANNLFGLCVVNYVSGNYAKAIDYGNSYLETHGSNTDIKNYIKKSLEKQTN